MRRVFCLLFVLSALFHPLHAAAPEEAIFSVQVSSKTVNADQKFIVLTIPKSGTHLINKLVTMLTDRKRNTTWEQPFKLGGFLFVGDNPECFIDNALFAEKLNSVFSKQEFPITHFNLGTPVKTFLQTHPDWVPIIQIRDLRDACVSCVFMCKDAIAKEIGTYNFDQQLMYVITMRDKTPANKIINIYRYAEEAVYWYHREDVIVCRFEHLVGEQGGGSLEKQQQQVLAIAQALKVDLDADGLDVICRDLFGVTRGPQLYSNFRKGQIGSWKQYFKYSHQKAFKHYMGHLQSALGYPED